MCDQCTIRLFIRKTNVSSFSHFNCFSIFKYCVVTTTCTYGNGLVELINKLFPSIAMTSVLQIKRKITTLTFSNKRKLQSNSNIFNNFIVGVVQGMVTGMRGLCNGLGPAMFGMCIKQSIM